MDPRHHLTPAEIENLDRLEDRAQRGLATYVEVGDALAEIRDKHLYRGSHPSFETYVRERWGVDVPNGDPPSQVAARPEGAATALAKREPCAELQDRPYEALARACEQTLSALAGDDATGIEIKLAIRKPGDRRPREDGRSVGLWNAGEPAGLERVPMLRWLLSQAGGTIGDVAHQLESHAAEIDDRARAQLRDDVLVLDGELAVIKALLVEVLDWDSELSRLLEDELPPPDADIEAEDDD